MKEISFILILLFTCGILPAQKKYTVPAELQAQSFPGHTEITWKNRQGFTYEIYRSVGNNKSFVKQNETSKDYYLDFYEKTTPFNIQIFYRIVPKGLSSTSTNVSKFEISVNRKPYTDEDLLDMTQRYTTRYFFDFAEPFTGMARERSNDDKGDIVTTGGTGFGLMALVAGMERNYFPKEKGLEIINKIVRFLDSAERFHGAWAHWYDADTRKAFNFSKYDDGGDLVETALLMQGLLVAREYLKKGDNKEIDLAKKITYLWETVEWNWYTRGTDSLYWHWSKNHGWKMNHRIKGFDETLITYVLAVSSPTHPIDAKIYEACFKKSPYFLNGKSYFGIKLNLGMDYGGPLFFTHYSFLGLNPNGLTDRHTNYFEQNKAHALIHRAYAVHNPKNHAGYGARLWGFTSSDDPLVGYSSHHPGTDADNGTVSPTAAISSIVYTPKESMEVLKYLYFEKGKQVFNKYGFYDAYNPGMPEGQQVVKSYLAIDQGPIAVMIENYRSGLIWNLFMSNPEIKAGLKKLGFYTSYN